MRRASWTVATALVIVLSACSDDAPDKLAGFACGPTACPPGWYCENMDDSCQDCSGPDCLALDDNSCTESADCPLDAFVCVDGHCAPTRTCTSDGDCEADRFCWGVRVGAPRYEPGICLTRETSCAGDVPCLAGSCGVCVWGEWSCIAEGIYPEQVCVR